MADRIRFHLNEHVDPAIATALRRAGIDVTTTSEAGLRTQDDQAHLGYARDEGRVIVTRDQDFLRLASEFTSANQSAPRTTENSPAIHRWGRVSFHKQVREADG